MLRSLSGPSCSILPYYVSDCFTDHCADEDVALCSLDSKWFVFSTAGYELQGYYIIKGL